MLLKIKFYHIKVILFIQIAVSKNTKYLSSPHITEPFLQLKVTQNIFLMSQQWQRTILSGQCLVSCAYALSIPESINVNCHLLWNKYDALSCLLLCVEFASKWRFLGVSIEFNVLSVLNFTVYAENHRSVLGYVRKMAFDNNYERSLFLTLGDIKRNIKILCYEMFSQLGSRCSRHKLWY